MKNYKYDIDKIIIKGDELDEKHNQLKYRQQQKPNMSHPLENTASEHIKYNSDQFNANKYNRVESTSLDRTSDQDVANFIVQIKPSSYKLDSSVEYPGFEISRDLQTVQRTGGDESTRRGFMCSDTINYVGVIEFTFIINKTTDHAIFIGFTNKDNNLSEGASKSKPHWLLYLSNGRLNNGNIGSNLTEFKRSENCPYFVTFNIDTTTDELWIKSLDYETSRVKLDLIENNKNKLVPCIDIRKIGDQVSIY